MREFAADFETSKIIHYDVPTKKEYYEAFKLIEYKDENNEKQFKYEKTKTLKKIINRKKSKTWVYLWGMKDVQSQKEYVKGYDIDSFLSYVRNYKEDMKIYFHNLKFDSSFILYHLLENNYKQLISMENYYFNDDMSSKGGDNFEFINDIYSFNVERHFKSVDKISKKGICKENACYFQSSVSSMGVVYSLKLYYLVKGCKLHRVEIYDSLKLLPFSIDTLGKKFVNMEDMEKMDYDYSIVRKENCKAEITDYDLEYLERDIDILANSLKLLKEDTNILGGLNKNTIASLALDEFKSLLYEEMHQEITLNYKDKEDAFRMLLPELSRKEDDFIRKSYKGGFCYVEPSKQNLLLEYEGMTVIDVNSLFPYIMLKNSMPYGMPLYSDKNEIKPMTNEDGEIYDYYFTTIRVNFKLKDRKIPSIMLKGNDFDTNFNFDNAVDLESNKYLESSENQLVELTMTKDDYELMHQQYDILEMYIIETFYFKNGTGIFDRYINKWGDLKIKASIEGNETLRQIAKLFLNSLYGKFGSNPVNIFKYYHMEEESYLKSSNQLEKREKGVYVPMASCITAGARRKTIEASQRIMDYGYKYYNDCLYYYSDTDSIHSGLTVEELVECLGSEIDIDNTEELGLWSIEEENIIRAKFIRPKTYMEERRTPKKGVYISTGIAGLPKDLQNKLTFDTFSQGSVFMGKLMPRQVPGGIALIDSEFSIN